MELTDRESNWTRACQARGLDTGVLYSRDGKNPPREADREMADRANGGDGLGSTVEL